MFEGQQVLPAVPGDLCSSPCAISHGVDQISRVTADQVRGPVVLTSSHGRLAIGSEHPQGRPALPGYLRLGSEGPQVRPEVTGDA